MIDQSITPELSFLILAVLFVCLALLAYDRDWPWRWFSLSPEQLTATSQRLAEIEFERRVHEAMKQIDRRERERDGITPITRAERGLVVNMAERRAGR